MSDMKAEKLNAIFRTQLEQAYRAGQQSILKKMESFTAETQELEGEQETVFSRQMERAMTQLTLLADEDTIVSKRAKMSNPQMAGRLPHHALRPGPRLFNWLNTFRQDFEALEVVHWGPTLVEIFLTRFGPTDIKLNLYLLRTTVQLLQDKVLLELQEAGTPPNMMASRYPTNDVRKVLKQVPLSEKLALDYGQFIETVQKYQIDLGTEMDALFAYGATKAKWRLDMSRAG